MGRGWQLPGYRLWLLQASQCQCRPQLWGGEQETDAFLVHCPAEALQTAMTLVGHMYIPPMGVCQGSIWNRQGPEPAILPPECKQLLAQPFPPTVTQGLGSLLLGSRRGYICGHPGGGMRPAWPCPQEHPPAGPTWSTLASGTPALSSDTTEKGLE